MNILPVLYVGIVPGIFGHALINYLLKIMSPLLISVFLNLEPIIGSLIGYGFGLQGTPTVWTFVGGVMIVVGNIMVTITEFKPNKPKTEVYDAMLDEFE